MGGKLKRYVHRNVHAALFIIVKIWKQPERPSTDERIKKTWYICTMEYYSAIKEQPVHSEGDQPWDFFGRNDAKAETPVLGPPHEKS